MTESLKDQTLKRSGDRKRFEVIGGEQAVHLPFGIEIAPGDEAPYLLGKYCASSDEVTIQMGLQVVLDTLANNYIRADEAGKAQSRVKEQGKYTFIDKVKVRLVDSDYWAESVNFGDRFLHIPTQYIRDYERLLMGGIWAQLDMRFEYDEAERGKHPFWIDKLVPIQIATFDVEEYRRLRRDFTTDEWIDLMLRSVGYPCTASRFILR